MTEAFARQVADLLNSQNELTSQYTPARILEYEERYILRLNEHGDRLLGVVEVKVIQWYQCEIDHLSVDPSAKRQGVGSSLLQEAEVRARQLAARVAQCTIRVGNLASEKLFKKRGYASTVTFINATSGNHVTVY